MKANIQPPSNISQIKSGVVLYNPYSNIVTRFSMTNPTYLEQIISFREDRGKRLKDDPVGWLALIGLFRLEEGDDPFGASNDNKIVLPEFGRERCGVFQLENTKTTLFPMQGVELTINQMPARKQQLHTDLDKEADRIEMRSLTMMVIQRGDKYYLRVWDRESKALKEFNGLEYFPIDPKIDLMPGLSLMIHPEKLKFWMSLEPNTKGIYLEKRVLLLTA